MPGIARIVVPRVPHHVTRRKYDCPLFPPVSVEAAEACEREALELPLVPPYRAIRTNQISE